MLVAYFAFLLSLSQWYCLCALPPFRLGLILPGNFSTGNICFSSVSASCCHLLSLRSPWVYFSDSWHVPPCSWRFGSSWLNSVVTWVSSQFWFHWLNSLEDWGFSSLQHHQILSPHLTWTIPPLQPHATFCTMIGIPSRNYQSCLGTHAHLRGCLTQPRTTQHVLSWMLQELLSSSLGPKCNRDNLVKAK